VLEGGDLVFEMKGASCRVVFKTGLL